MFSFFFFIPFIAIILHICSPHSSKEPPTNTSESTLVTAWYPHPGYCPKYPNQTEYRERVREILSHVSSPIVIYTPPEEAGFLRSARPNHLPMVLNHTYGTIWDAPPLQPYVHSFHTQQRVLALHEGDPYASEDTGHMYGVWNAKVHFLQQVTYVNHFSSSFFFWLDLATSLEATALKDDWPDAQRVRYVLSKSKGWQDNVLVNVRELKPCIEQEYFREMNAPLHRTIAGGFLGGSKKAIEWLNDIYYSTLEYYHSLDQFVGIDEELLLAIAMLNPDKFVSIPAYRYRDPTFETLDHVWYFRDYLAKQTEKQQLNTLPGALLFRDVPFYSPCNLTMEGEAV